MFKIKSLDIAIDPLEVEVGMLLRLGWYRIGPQKVFLNSRVN